MTNLTIKEAWKIWWETPRLGILLTVLLFTVVRFIVVTALKFSDDPDLWHY